MKPSTHKKIKNFKQSATKRYYKIMKPLAWLIEKVENANNNRMKKKATVDYVAKLLAKEFYKYLCKYPYNNNSSVVIAEWVDSDVYTSPSQAIQYFTFSKSKARKYSRKLNLYDKKVVRELFERIMVEFEILNEYTYAHQRVEDMKHKWGLRGYEYTYYFGFKEDNNK